MLNKKLTIISSVLSISFLLGCGGGGGGGSDSSATDSGSSSSTTTQSTLSVSDENIPTSHNLEQDIAQASAQMQALQASADFNFSNKNQVTVNVDLQALLAENNQTGARAYLSIYSDYQRLDSGSYYPKSSSRVLAGDLFDGQFKQSFIALNNQSTYLIEVWFYDGEQPIQQERQIVANNLTW